MSGLLLHKDDVFVHVSHKHGYEGPMLVEEEGFLAGSPLVCLSWHSLGPGLLSRGSALLAESLHAVLTSSALSETLPGLTAFQGFLS